MVICKTRRNCWTKITGILFAKCSAQSTNSRSRDVWLLLPSSLDFRRSDRCDEEDSPEWIKASPKRKTMSLCMTKITTMTTWDYLWRITLFCWLRCCGVIGQLLSRAGCEAAPWEKEIFADNYRRKGECWSARCWYYRMNCYDPETETFQSYR